MKKALVLVVVAVVVAFAAYWIMVAVKEKRAASVAWPANLGTLAMKSAQRGIDYPLEYVR
jgi:hypothetical protein